MSGNLTLRHGKGFSRSNVIRIRQFYPAYPIGATASHLLSGSHRVERLKLGDPLKRSFYVQQTTTTVFEFEGTPGLVRRPRSNHGEFATFGSND